MTRKIFYSILIAVIAVLVLSFSVVTGVLYSNLAEEGKSKLNDQLSLAVQGVEMDGERYLAGLSGDNYRITWVAADGSVLYDTDVKSWEMDNHIDREEIKEALQSGSGESYRYSSTLTEKMIYSAQRLSDGTVLRISTSHDSIFALLFDVLIPIILIVLMAIMLSAFFARRMARGIVKPLNELDLDNPTENDAYEELSPMLGKISKQRRQIDEHIIALRRRADEFDHITRSMNEGLVLLDKKGFILSMNPAAKTLFAVDEVPVGRDFLTVDRSPQMSRAIENAYIGEHSEFHEQRDGGEYRFGVSGIVSNGKNVGAVVLCVDVTDEAFAERNRQEFTANVSHELKTPLQSIIGSAELLENGLVKPQDMQRFVGNIKKEATRLVLLINDIIRLSQLDENRESATESVDLYDVAKEAMEGLAVSAESKQVELCLNGESCEMNGVRRYLYEIIYNLCDNAIRYNVAGGKVTVNISRDMDNVVLTVSDTGIGIPPEHHNRIFERFYRVDKSHSKETGGTGLGLSIVKHAVAFHGGKVKLDSAVGKGTTVTIIF